MCLLFKHVEAYLRQDLWMAPDLIVFFLPCDILWISITYSFWVLHTFWKCNEIHQCLQLIWQYHTGSPCPEGQLQRITTCPCWAWAPAPKSQLHQMHEEIWRNTKNCKLLYLLSGKNISIARVAMKFTSASRISQGDYFSQHWCQVAWSVWP